MFGNIVKVTRQISILSKSSIPSNRFWTIKPKLQGKWVLFGIRRSSIFTIKMERRIGEPPVYPPPIALKIFNFLKSDDTPASDDFIWATFWLFAPHTLYFNRTRLRNTHLSSNSIILGSFLWNDLIKNTVKYMILLQSCTIFTGWLSYKEPDPLKFYLIPLNG